MNRNNILALVVVCFSMGAELSSGHFEIRITPAMTLLRKVGEQPSLEGEILSRSRRQSGSLQAIDAAETKFRPVQVVQLGQKFIPSAPMSFGPMKLIEPLQPKQDIASYLPHELKDYKRIHPRYQAPQCVPPNPVEGSEIVCQFTDLVMNCTQTCVFGHTTRVGIFHTFYCESGQWFGGAERCQPFVDCSVTPGPGGSVKCLSNFMHKGTRCWTQCKDYEDKRATPMVKHACDIEGRWNPPLPHCIMAGSGMGLVPPPDKKLMSNYGENFGDILL